MSRHALAPTDVDIAQQLTDACAIVRADIHRTDVGDNGTPAEESAFLAGYGTDADIQAHVLDWAYMFEEPDPADLDADPAYAEFIAAWKYVMKHGTHPNA